MKASIIVPAYNAGHFIEQTLNSILGQCDESIEIIVVDDGSTDDTLARIQAYGQRIRCVQQANSGGAASPRNRALSLAKGEFIFFFDSDDLMLGGKIAATLDMFATQPGLGLVFTNFETIDSNGHRLKENFLSEYPTIRELEADRRDHYVLTSDFAHSRLAQENFIGTSSAAVPRRVMDEIGPFNIDYYCGEDWDMWLRIAERYPIGYLPRILHSYRRHDGNITASDPMRTITSQIAMMTKHLKASSNQEFRRKIVAMIAERHFSLAYIHYRKGNTADARSMLRLAAVAMPKSKILITWFKILLGSQAGARIKRILGRSTS